MQTTAEASRARFSRSPAFGTRGFGYPQTVPYNRYNRYSLKCSIAKFDDNSSYEALLETDAPINPIATTFAIEAVVAHRMAIGGIAWRHRGRK
jgi:hypothetical protein